MGGKNRGEMKPTNVRLNLVSERVGDETKKNDNWKNTNKGTKEGK